MKTFKTYYFQLSPHGEFTVCASSLNKAIKKLKKKIVDPDFDLSYSPGLLLTGKVFHKQGDDIQRRWIKTADAQLGEITALNPMLSLRQRLESMGGVK